MKADLKLATGQLIDDRYRIERALGAGSTGAVYAARDESLANGGPVAVKVISSEHVGDDHRSGLELEFGLLARLRHPNIVNALAIGTASNGAVYLVEELVDGPTLQAARHTIEAVDYFWIAHGILEGLSHIHRRDWVHHDIKPSNILLEKNTNSDGFQWRPKLADLGVASMRGSDPAGRISGTIPFLSPERLVGKLADPRSDIWALGMTLFFCLTDTLPVHTSDVAEASRILRSNVLPAVRDLRPDVPAGLESVISRMLARAGRARYSDGSTALADLRRHMLRAGLEVPELPASALVHTPAFVGREWPLVSTLSRLSASRGSRVAIIQGKRGSGRTRMLDEIALECQLVGARAVFVEPGIGVAPWKRTLAQLGASVDGHRVESITEALQEAFKERAAVVFIDNLDHRDDATQQIVERIRDHPLNTNHLSGIVASCCMPCEHAQEGEVIHIAPLSSEEIVMIAESCLGDHIGLATESQLVSVAAGNPSRLIQAINHAIEEGVLRRIAGSWELDDPNTELSIDDAATQEVVDQLDKPTMRLLGALAVLGPRGASVDTKLALSISGHPREESTTAIGNLCQLGLAHLTRSPGASTPNVAINSHIGALVLASIDAKTRRALHHRAWKAYQDRDDTDPAVIARHAWGAGSVAEALELTHEATVTALNEGNYSSVLALTQQFDGDLPELDQALFFEIRVARAHALVELSRPLDGSSLAQSVLAQQPRNRRASEIIVRAAVIAGDHPRAQQSLSKAKQVVDNSHISDIDRLEYETLDVEVAQLTQSPEAVRAAARAAFNHFRRVRGSSHPPSAAEAIERRVLRAEGRVLTAEGAALSLAGDLDEGVPILQRGLDIFEELEDLPRIAEASAFLAAAADIGGSESERSRHVTRGLEAAQRAGANSAAARLLNVRGIGYLWQGRHIEAIEAFAEAEGRAQRSGLYRVTSAVSGNLVVVHRRAAQYTQALAAASRSLTIKQPLGDTGGVLSTMVDLADLYADLGAPKLSSAAAARVIRRALAGGYRRLEVKGRIAFASALAKQGKGRAAAVALTPLSNRKRIEYQERLDLELALAVVSAASGNRSDAIDSLLILEEVAADRNEPYLAATAALKRAILLGEQGAKDLQRAIENATQCRARHLMWMARARLGLVLSAQGKPAAAGAEYVRANEILEDVLTDIPTRHQKRYIGGPRQSLVAVIRGRAHLPPRALPNRPRRLLHTTSVMSTNNAKPPSVSPSIVTTDMRVPTTSRLL